MPAIHDYKCKNCNHVVMEQMEIPTECPCGTPEFFWTAEFWTKDKNPLAGRRDFRTSNCLEDVQGRRRRFTALEDPTCQIELGMMDGNGIGTFNQEQRQYYAGKILRDGDTPAMRREILDTRISNQKARGEDAPDSFGS